MGLELQDLKKITELRRSYASGKNALILGDCVFHFDKYSLFKITQGVELKEFRSTKVLLKDFEQALGFDKVVSVDLFGSPTIKIDLQEDILEDLTGKFDWIIDAGTMFCCFDIASVWKNTLVMLKENGCIFHLSSLAGYLGRGYYSFSPQLFLDFYNSNGFEIIEMGARVKPKKARLLISLINKITAFCGLRGKRHLEWNKINIGDCYLNKSTPYFIEFSNSYKKNEPDMIPNNSLIMCFAKRIKTCHFKKAVPDFYKNFNSEEACEF